MYKKIIFVSILFGFMFSFFYNTLVVTDFERFQIKLKEVKDVQFELPLKDKYLLKVWGTEAPKGIYFNDQEVNPFRVRERRESKEFYINLPFERTNKGTNSLRIVSPVTYSVKIKNCLGRLGKKEAVILFADSEYLNRVFSKEKFIFLGLLIGFILGGIWWLISTLFIPIRKFFFRYWMSYLPCLLFFLALFLFCLTPYRIVLSKGFFIGMSLFLVGIVKFFSVFLCLWRDKEWRVKMEDRGMEPANALIITFIILLLMCPFLLMLKLEAIAELAGIIAYIALAFGIGMKFRRFMREEKK